MLHPHKHSFDPHFWVIVAALVLMLLTALFSGPVAGGEWWLGVDLLQ